MTGSVADRWAHFTFLASMIGKGALGLFQILGGVVLLVTPSGSLNAIVRQLASMELVEDPKDFLANWAMNAVQNPHFANENFYIVYLLIHGGLNLGLVLALLARMMWAYPVSVLALAGFIVFQLYKFANSGDVLMLVLSAIDVIVLWLIWREWGESNKRGIA